MPYVDSIDTEKALLMKLNEEGLNALTVEELKELEMTVGFALRTKEREQSNKHHGVFIVDKTHSFDGVTEINLVGDVSYWHSCVSHDELILVSETDYEKLKELKALQEFMKTWKTLTHYEVLDVNGIDADVHHKVYCRYKLLTADVHNIFAKEINRLDEIRVTE